MFGALTKSPAPWQTLDLSLSLSSFIEPNICTIVEHLQWTASPWPDLTSNTSSSIIYLDWLKHTSSYLLNYFINFSTLINRKTSSSPLFLSSWSFNFAQPFNSDRSGLSCLHTEAGSHSPCSGRRLHSTLGQSNVGRGLCGTPSPPSSLYCENTWMYTQKLKDKSQWGYNSKQVWRSMKILDISITIRLLIRIPVTACYWYKRTTVAQIVDETCTCYRNRGNWGRHHAPLLALLPLLSHCYLSLTGQEGGVSASLWSLTPSQIKGKRAGFIGFPVTSWTS